jgi:hypothetical protein
MIELTDLGGNKIFVNRNKIIHFYRVEANISYNKKPYTQVLLDNCSLQVEEAAEEVCIICNNKI